MKKILSLLTSAIMTLSMLFTSGAQVIASIYEEDYNDIIFNCIIKLPGDPLAKYPMAQSLGVDKFIFTDEGQSAYETLIEEHTTAKKYLTKLLGKKSLTSKYEYTAAYNGFSAELSHAEYKKIKSNIGSMVISDIYEVSYIGIESEKGMNNYQNADENESNYSLYSYSELTNKVLETVGASEIDYKGDETVIAIIDNSFDRYHEFLSLPDGATEKLTQKDIINISPYLSATQKKGSDYYVSNKIPFAFNYGSQTPNTLKDFHIHGTHVAGIAAGNGQAKTNPQFDPKGVAPNAQLVLMSDINLNSENLLAAYDDCLYLGTDIINTSFGVSGSTAIEERIFEPDCESINNIINTGVMFCSSAGNDGKLEVIENNYLDYSTGGYPNNISGIMSVGSAENYFQETSVVTVNENQYEIINSGYSISTAFNEKTLQYIPVPGHGEIDDYKEINVEGKIALVSRGKLTFSQKAYNAAEFGAVGLIVYDNDPNGELFGMDCKGIPSGFISYNSGMQMIEEKNKTISFSEKPYPLLKYDKEIMSGFSSWDFTESLILKPDITGFGGNIVSSIPDKNKKVHNLYGTMSGTSMSSPQIAGLNAVLKQYLKENADKYGIAGNLEYRELMAKLLMSTAKPISTNDGLEIASPRVQGNGLANVADAINTPCYLSSNSAVDNYRPKISLGENPSGEYILQFNIHNISESAQTYQLSADVFSDNMNADSTLSWNTQRLLNDTDYILTFEDSETGRKIDEITVEPTSVKPITAKITLTQNAYNKIFDTFENGTFIDGFINLKNETSPALTLSFMAFCGSWNENDQSDLIEQFIYKDNNNKYGSYLSDGINIAGLNIIETYGYSDNSEFNLTASHPYFSPIIDNKNNDKAFNNLFLEAYFKRRCYDVKVTIYNSAGQEIYSEIVGTGNIMINPLTHERASDLFEIGWDFRDIDGKIHNNENYTIQVSAKAPLSENYSNQVITQSFTVDTEKPIINQCSKLILGDAEYLIIDAEDNGSLQGAVSYDTFDEPILEDFSPVKTSNKNSILVRLPENTSESFVEIYDMAGNYETIYVNEVTDNIYLNINDKLEFASDEPTFKNKISFVDDNGIEKNISYSFSSTPAEVYENEEEETILIINGIETVFIPVQVGLRGDANNDKKLTAEDAAYIAKMLAHQQKDKLPLWSDYNQDGKITANDASSIAHYLANKYF